MFFCRLVGLYRHLHQLKTIVGGVSLPIGDSDRFGGVHRVKMDKASLTPVVTLMFVYGRVDL